MYTFNREFLLADLFQLFEINIYVLLFITMKHLKRKKRLFLFSCLLKKKKKKKKVSLLKNDHSRCNDGVFLHLMRILLEKCNMYFKELDFSNKFKVIDQSSK